MRALIVEDEAVTARDLGDILTHLGYKVCGIAADYDRAIAIADQENPEIAILDIRLKGELSGLDVAERLRETHSLPIVILSSSSDANTVKVARNLRVNGYIIKPFTEDIIFAAVETAFGNFLEEQTQLDDADIHSKGGLAAHKTNSLRDFIDENYAEPLTLDGLAERAGLSRFHFAAMFKQSFGEPPHRYIILKRVDAAKDLLATTDHPITEVAAAVGYENHGHFSTIFKRETGKSPSRFRSELAVR
ncbi:helix-turn-helix domain-containing protein [Tateyamaria sp. SN3-11]|uniref:helix-turn-helix domain-containing protein n=1 Tax=Tateyamaria sp. SN3-11 TaxID=3092147 RepID=UPI0039EAAF36